MTDDQINQRIAEACGWAHPTVEPFAYPNYCTDLNAMHDAEKVLTVEQWHDYVDFMPSRWEEAVHASARQRAEAFLRTLTIGLWRTSKETVGNKHELNTD